MFLTLRSHERCFIKELKSCVFSGYKPFFFFLFSTVMHAETALFCQINPESSKCEHVRRGDEIVLRHFEKRNAICSTGFIIPKNWLNSFAPVNSLSSPEILKLAVIWIPHEFLILCYPNIHYRVLLFTPLDSTPTHWKWNSVFLHLISPESFLPVLFFHLRVDIPRILHYWCCPPLLQKK